jgi:hypothetical protein
MPEFQSYNRSKNKNQKNQKPAGNNRLPPASPREIWAEPKKSIKSERPRQAKLQNSQSASAYSNAPNVPNHREYRPVRKSYVIHGAIAALLTAAIVVGLSVTVIFNTNDVVVYGDSIYTKDEIMSAGGIEEGVNLLRFDANQAQRGIMDSLVYLDSVVVQKQFPSVILITLEPAVRALSVIEAETGEFFEVSRNGRIISSSSARPEGLVVTGFVPIEPKIGGYLDCGEMEHTELVFQLVDLIEKHELEEINRVDISDRFDVRLFKGGESDSERIEVKLGAPTQLDGKIALTAEIITEQIAANEKGVLRISSPRKGTFKPYLE